MYKKTIVLVLLLGIVCQFSFASQLKDKHWAGDLYDAAMINGDISLNFSIDTPVSYDLWLTLMKAFMSSDNLASADNVTRYKVLEDLYQHLQIQSFSNAAITYKDVDAMSQNQLAVLGWAVDIGLINGYDDLTLKPNKQLTLAEALTIRERYIKYLLNKPNNVSGLSAYFKKRDANTATLVVDWGSKNTGGYVVLIQSYYFQGNDLLVHVYTKSPDDKDIVIQALTHPKAEKEIPMDWSKSYNIKLIVDHD